MSAQIWTFSDPPIRYCPSFFDQVGHQNFLDEFLNFLKDTCLPFVKITPYIELEPIKLKQGL